jgi:predicted dehydrogenase/threonine dehydrogenase-like Zn-dependent dehydrogenase
MVELAQKSFLGKARARPDLVRQVIEKVRRDGILSTIETVRSRLDAPIPLGYSSSGTVIEVGASVPNFQVGDRVACAGAGYANHAEIVFIPKHLTVRIPDEVDFESAAFATLGAIALQGLRLAEVQLGETVAVIGLGLVGLLTLQLAKAAGCRVLGMDPNSARTELAGQLGIDAVATNADGLRSIVHRLSSNHGADKVIITASTKSNESIILAGEVARDRGIVVAVGAVGLEIPRKTYYEKELTFRVSRSYGPGRYDPDYEEKGQDYPIGYVRWTENRNMEAFVQQLAEGKVNVKPLVTHRFPIDEAPKAYDLITGKVKEDYLGILLTYPESPKLSAFSFQPSASSIQPSAPTLERSALSLERSSILPPGQRPYGAGGHPRSSHRARGPTGPAATLHPIRIGLLGAGEFAKGTLLPAMEKVSGIEFAGVCTATGISAQHVARKFGFKYATTDENEIINNPDINTVVIATRHHLHAHQVIAALKTGKHVFVEKPLCLNEIELNEIIKTYNSSLITQHSAVSLQPSASSLQPVLMVGFNRRFSPMARQLKDFLKEVNEPLVMHYRINAGYIPPDHWVHDPAQGGGRIIGEVCHFVDFLTFLAGALPRQVYAKALPNSGHYRDDNLAITIEFANGSLGTINYVANGDKAFPKERVEVFGGEAVAVLDNFRVLKFFRNGHCKTVRSRWSQDKGHQGEWEALVSKIRSGQGPPILFEEATFTTLCTLSVIKSMSSGNPVDLHSGLPQLI